MAHLAVVNYICAVIKPRLGSDKTGILFTALQRDRHWIKVLLIKVPHPQQCISTLTTFPIQNQTS